MKSILHSEPFRKIKSNLKLKAINFKEYENIPKDFRIDIRYVDQLRVNK